MSAEIRLEGVRLEYGPFTALDGLSLTVGAGEVLALLGPSGSGKSSVIRAVLGFVVPREGTIRVRDRIVTSAGRVLVPPEERGVAVVFQDLALWPHLTVAENLGFGLEARRVSALDREPRIRAMLRSVGLEGSERRYPAELSGGQRQRVAIARALVLEPEAVVLDEPLANVDVDLRRELLALFGELFARHGTTVLYVTHDLREALPIAHRFAVIEAGRLVQAGRLEDLLENPVTRFVQSLVEDLEVRTHRPARQKEGKTPR
jgi:iron(III) transport system ATP-binding protein